MKNQGNTLNNTEKIKVDQHTLVLIKNRLHHYISHTKIVENTSFYISNVTHIDRNIL